MKVHLSRKFGILLTLGSLGVGIFFYSVFALTPSNTQVEIPGDRLPITIDINKFSDHADDINDVAYSASECSNISTGGTIGQNFYCSYCFNEVSGIAFKYHRDEKTTSGTAGTGQSFFECIFPARENYKSASTSKFFFYYKALTANSESPGNIGLVASINLYPPTSPSLSGSNHIAWCTADTATDIYVPFINGSTEECKIIGSALSAYQSAGNGDFPSYSTTTDYYKFYGDRHLYDMLLQRGTRNDGQNGLENCSWDDSPTDDFYTDFTYNLDGTGMNNTSVPFSLNATNGIGDRSTSEICGCPSDGSHGISDTVPLGDVPVRYHYSSPSPGYFEENYDGAGWTALNLGTENTHYTRVGQCLTKKIVMCFYLDPLSDGYDGIYDSTNDQCSADGRTYEWDSGSNVWVEIVTNTPPEVGGISSPDAYINISNETDFPITCSGVRDEDEEELTMYYAVVATGTTPTGGDWNDFANTINATATAQSFTEDVDLSGYTDGDYDIYCKANDGTDDSAVPDPITRTKDTAVPTLTAISPDNTQCGMITWTITGASDSGGTGLQSYLYSTDGSTWTSESWTANPIEITTSHTGSGTATLRIKLKDFAGNVSGQESSSPTTYDPCDKSKDLCTGTWQGTWEDYNPSTPSDMNGICLLQVSRMFNPSPNFDPSSIVCNNFRMREGDDGNGTLDFTDGAGGSRNPCDLDGNGIKQAVWNRANFTYSTNRYIRSTPETIEIAAEKGMQFNAPSEACLADDNFYFFNGWSVATEGGPGDYCSEKGMKTKANPDYETPLKSTFFERCAYDEDCGCNPGSLQLKDKIPPFDHYAFDENEGSPILLLNNAGANVIGSDRLSGADFANANPSPEGQCLDEHLVTCLFLETDDGTQSKFFFSEGNPICETRVNGLWVENEWNGTAWTRGICYVGEKNIGGQCFSCSWEDEYKNECCGESRTGLEVYHHSNQTCYTEQAYECKVLINKGNPYIDEISTPGMFDFETFDFDAANLKTGNYIGFPFFPHGIQAPTTSIYFNATTNPDFCKTSCQYLFDQGNGDEKFPSLNGSYYVIEGPGGTTVNRGPRLGIGSDGKELWNTSSVTFQLKSHLEIPHLGTPASPSVCQWTCKPNTGLTWNGSTCECDSGAGYFWDSDKKTCVDPDGGLYCEPNCDTENPDPPAINMRDATFASEIINKTRVAWEMGNGNDEETASFLSPAKEGITDFIIRFRIPNDALLDSNFASGDPDIVRWSITGSVPDGDGERTIHLSSVPKCFQKDGEQVIGGALCTTHFTTASNICGFTKPGIPLLGCTMNIESEYTIVELKNPIGIVQDSAELMRVDQFFDRYQVMYPTLTLEYINPPILSDGSKLAYIEYQLFIKPRTQPTLATMPSGAKIINATATISGLKQSIDIRIEDKEPVPFLHYGVTF